MFVLLIIEHDGEEKRFLLQYEKLMDFCYVCGHLNHVEKNYFMSYIAAKSHQFGDWLHYIGKDPRSFTSQVTVGSQKRLPVEDVGVSST